MDENLKRARQVKQQKDVELKAKRAKKKLNLEKNMKKGLQIMMAQAEENYSEEKAELHQVVGNLCGVGANFEVSNDLCETEDNEFLSEIEQLLATVKSEPVEESDIKNVQITVNAQQLKTFELDQYIQNIDASEQKPETAGLCIPDDEQVEALVDVDGLVSTAVHILAAIKAEPVEDVFEQNITLEDVVSKIDEEHEAFAITSSQSPKDIFSAHAIINRDRYIIGYGEKNQMTMAVKDLQIPEVLRIYNHVNTSPDGYNTFNCRCNKHLIEFNGTISGPEKSHNCSGLSFRAAFFLLKKWTLLHGTIEDVEVFETAMYSENDDAHYVKVDQRDWVFGGVDENTIFIREPDTRQLARKYVIHTIINENKVSYRCDACGIKKGTGVILHKLPSGVFVVWRDPREKHYKCSCAVNMSSLMPIVKSNFEESWEFDNLRIVPEEEIEVNSLERSHRIRILDTMNSGMYQTFVNRVRDKCQYLFLCYHCKSPDYRVYSSMVDDERRIVAPLDPHFCQNSLSKTNVNKKMMGAPNEIQPSVVDQPNAFDLEYEFRRAVILSRNNWYIGRWKKKTEKPDMLLLRLNGSDAAIMFSFFELEDYDFKVGLCPCKKKLFLMEDGTRIEVRGNENENHKCKPVSFRCTLFQFKKMALMFGSEQEIDYYNKATCSTCPDPNFVKMDQNNWSLKTAKKSKVLTTIYVQEEGLTHRSELVKRRTFRQYVLQSKRHKSGKKMFICAGCPNKAPRLIVDHLKSGIHVVWESLDDQHSLFCYPKFLPEFEKEYLNIKLDYEMDIYQLAPEWRFGFNAKLSAKKLVIVRDRNDESLCRVFVKKQRKGKHPSLACFKCVKCGLACFDAFAVIDDDTRLLLSNHRHHHCEPSSYASVLLEQEEFSGMMSVLTFDQLPVGSSTVEIPKLDNNRIKMDKKRTYIIVKEKEFPRTAYKFLIVPINPRGYSKTAVFKCMNCKCLTFMYVGRVRRGLGNYLKIAIRSLEEHEAFCHPIPAAEWNAVVEEEEEVFKIEPDSEDEDSDDDDVKIEYKCKREIEAPAAEIVVVKSETERLNQLQPRDGESKNTLVNVSKRKSVSCVDQVHEPVCLKIPKLECPDEETAATESITESK